MGFRELVRWVPKFCIKDRSTVIYVRDTVLPMLEEHVEAKSDPLVSLSIRIIKSRLKKAEKVISTLYG